jgi:3-oxoacyl-(acyl-carrier-protein) synthase
VLSRLGRLARTADDAVPLRPGHRGIAPADAACFAVVEARERAERRGARILARIGGAHAGRYNGVTAAGFIEARTATWSRAAAEAPDVLLSIGNVDEAADRAEGDAARSLWGAASPRLASFDGSLGHHGAAAPFTAIALAAKLFDRAAPPLPGWGSRPVRSALVAVADPDGGHGVVSIAAPEGAS